MQTLCVQNILLYPGLQLPATNFLVNWLTGETFCHERKDWEACDFHVGICELIALCKWPRLKLSGQVKMQQINVCIPLTWTVEHHTAYSSAVLGLKWECKWGDPAPESLFPAGKLQSQHFFSFFLNSPTESVSTTAIHGRDSHPLWKLLKILFFS